MKGARLVLTIGLGLLLVLVGVASLAQASRREAFPGPKEVAAAYYGELISGFRDTEGPHNQLADGSYRESSYLTGRMVQSIDETVAGFERGGYDPCLCAQDVPMVWEVTGVEMHGDLAQVWIEMLWSGNPMAYRVPVILRQADGAWRIDEVRCHLAEHAPLTAEQTVTQFYVLYLDMIQRQNPLATGDYRYLPFLAPGFVSEVDALLASFEGSGYDPFLCAQDWPTEVVVEPGTVVDGVARVAVRTSFEGHGFMVELRQEGGVWAITNIVCEWR